MFWRPPPPTHYSWCVPNSSAARVLATRSSSVFTWGTHKRDSCGDPGLAVPMQRDVFDHRFAVSNFPHLFDPRRHLKLKNKNQLEATYYFIVLLIGSTCFGHYYAHHQELAIIMLINTLVVSFLVCCRLEVRCS